MKSIFQNWPDVWNLKQKLLVKRISKFKKSNLGSRRGKGQYRFIAAEVYKKLLIQDAEAGKPQNETLFTMLCASFLIYLSLYEKHITSADKKKKNLEMFPSLSHCVVRVSFLV